MATPSYPERMQLLRRDYDRIIRLRLEHQKAKANGGYKPGPIQNKRVETGSVQNTAALA